MFKIGDLVKIKDKFVGASEEKNLLMLVTKIEKGFYQKNAADYAHRTDRITMFATNGETYSEPAQCLEIISEA